MTARTRPRIPSWWPYLLVGVAGPVIGGAVGLGAAPLLASMAMLAAVMGAPNWVAASVLVVVGLLPLTIGDVGAVPDVLFVEVAVPAFAPLVAWRWLRGRRAAPAAGLAVAMGACAMLAVGLLHAAGVISGGAAFGPGAIGGNRRAYYDMACAVALMFEVAVLVHGSGLERRQRGLLGGLAILAAVLGVVRVAGYYLGFEMPIMSGVFRYGVLTQVGSRVADRIGGLSEAAVIGLACLAGLWRMGEKRLLLPGVTLFLGVVLLSGGRTSAVGLVLAGLALVLSESQRSRWSVLAGTVVAAVAVVVVAAMADLPQLNRVTAIAGGIAGQDPARAASMRFQWMEFIRAPLVGKGIGAPGVGLSDPFVAEQVRQGGHSAYMSLLANFGIVGFAGVSLVVALAIYQSFRAASGRLDKDEGSGLRGLGAFCLVLLIVRAVNYLTGGNGYSDFGLYAVVGLLYGALWGSENVAPRNGDE